MEVLRIAARNCLLGAVALIALCGGRSRSDDSWAVYPGGDGPGKWQTRRAGQR